MEHYIPLHPQVVDAIKPLLDQRNNNDLFFEYNSLLMWLKRLEGSCLRTFAIELKHHLPRPSLRLSHRFLLSRAGA